MNQPPDARYITDAKSRNEQYQIIEEYIKNNYPNVSGTCYAYYCGKQLEELWYDEFHNKPIEDFGIFVPIFVKYVNLYFGLPDQYGSFVNGLFKILNPNFLYITVSSYSDGIETVNNLKVPENVFIVSGGGLGHVPFHIFLKEQPALNVSKEPKYTTVFMGDKGRHDVRKKMIDICKQKLGEKFYTGFNDRWVKTYQDTKVILTPRGYGRNSFRFTEVLQMRMIPINIYSDIPWVPYYDSINWSEIAFIIKIEQLNQTLDKIEKMSYEELEKMRRKILLLRDTHFTVKGALGQLANFMKYGFEGTDLRCGTRKYKRT
ncbi:exostosin family protein [Histomonas meleagridis]|uniref:exostosin family protein n=1 Tax=Histomonas meleagridis TaxID=135588 RepID=UPI00355A9987|nr:exostosin family protein [Histomonas meleagridis]KAH0801529.1 exostosin family protein [Histomonas meleagridis]